MDNEKEVERDIEEFKRTGKLPKEYDVKRTRKETGNASPYWNHVAREGGEGNIANSGEVAAPDSPPSATDYAPKFMKWLDREFPKLSQDDRELFLLFWEKHIPLRSLARYYNVTPRTLQMRVARIKESIASYIGLRL